MGSVSCDILIDEAQSFYKSSPAKVKDLAHKFFESMDTNNSKGVDFKEIQSFLEYGKFVIGPYNARALFKELDRDRNKSLNFEEFISFFYIVFMKARCGRCNVSLIGKTRRTCVICFVSGDNNNKTYDLCSICYHFYRYHHRHDKHEMKKFTEVVFNGKVPGHGLGTGDPCSKIDGTVAGTHSGRLCIAIQLAATITASCAPVFAALAGCSIL